MTVIHVTSDLDPAELENYWLNLERISDRARDFITQEQSRVASVGVVTDRRVKQEQAEDAAVYDESYVVLTAWAELFHAAMLFATHGTRSVFLDGTPLQEHCGVPDVVAGCGDTRSAG